MNIKNFIVAAVEFPFSKIAIFVLVFLYTANASVHVVATAMRSLPGYQVPAPDLWLTIQILIQTIVAVACFWLFSRYWDKTKLAEKSLSKEHMWIDLGMGFVIGALLVAVMVLVLWLFGIYSVESLGFNHRIWVPLVLCFFVGIEEETIFRGFMLRVVEKRWGTASGLIVSSILFGFAHMLNRIQGITEAEQVFGCICLIFEAGLLFGAAFLVRRTLWLPVGIHWSWNFFEGAIFGLPVSGTDIGGSIMTASLQGNFLATGGAFGPEASLAGLVVGTAFSIILLYWVIRNDGFRRE